MNFLGGFIIMRLGGFVRYLYGTFIRKIGLSKSPFYTLHEYIHGSKRPDDEHWDKGGSHEFVNRVVGMITLVVICFTLLRIERLF